MTGKNLGFVTTKTDFRIYISLDFTPLPFSLPNCNTSLYRTRKKGMQFYGGLLEKLWQKKHMVKFNIYDLFYYYKL